MGAAPGGAFALNIEGGPLLALLFGGTLRAIADVTARRALLADEHAQIV